MHEKLIQNVDVQQQDQQEKKQQQQHIIALQETIKLDGIIPASKTSSEANDKTLTIKELDQNSLLFNHYSRGSTGQVIKDMLMIHAYSYQQGKVYGGSCGEPHNMHSVHMSLLELIGLEGQLKFSCPRDHGEDRTTKRSVIPHQDYRDHDTSLFTPNYLAYLRSHVQYPTKAVDRFTIAVHIRRGKIYSTPCGKGQREGYQHYLPNSHYQRLIDLYMQPGARVVVFSSGNSEESLNEFSDKGYEVEVDGKITEAWSTMITSDVLILSRSTFALAPALITRGRVVYTPFWHKAIDSWDVVDDLLMQQTAADMEQLKINHSCS